MSTVKRTFLKGKETIELDLDSFDIFRDSLLNKGTGFTNDERTELGLHGLIPYHTSMIEEQVKRCYVHFYTKESALSKYQFLSILQDQNEILFYRLCSEYPEEILPYIYTPTVGDAALHFSYLHSRNRGVYLSYPHKDFMEEIINNLPRDRVDVIVVTDGARILGLGDLGIGGMTIPIGKLSLYSLFGGIHPAYTLPITLDVGTDNETLLRDPLYLGWRHARLSGKEYDGFVDTFIKVITKRYPNVLIQWEDFSKEQASRLLDHYRDKICCFNDDIQGTAAVVLAGLFGVLQGMNGEIRDQRVVSFGAGSAGIGIVELIMQAMIEEGMTCKEAKERIFVMGRNGLVHTGSKDLDDLKKRFVQQEETIQKWKVKDKQNITLLETVQHAKPSILIGTSAQSGSFTKEVITEMKKHVIRPIIFPLSNPVSKSEAEPADLMKWTQGQALIATGSPYQPVKYGKKSYVIGQCNNVFIFPGVGLGVIASRATRVTHRMFLEAAKILSHYAPIIHNPYASLFPRLTELRAISRDIAIGVAKEAIKEGVCSNPPKEIEQAVKDNMWAPNYPHLKKIKK